MDGSDGLVETVQGLGVVILTIAITAVVLNAIAVITLSSGFAAVEADTGSSTTIDGAVNEIPFDVTVKASNEQSVDLSGAGAVTANVSDFSTGDWSACASPQLASDAPPDGAYNVLAYQNASVLVQYDAGEWRAIYDNGTQSADATVPAPSPADGWTHVCARHDASAGELTLNAAGNSSTVNLTTTTAVRNVSESWTGRLDEVRIWNRTLSSSEVNAYETDTVLPITGDRVARFQFDEGSGTNTQVYFAGDTADIGSASWAQGLAADEAPESAYGLSGDPFSVTLASGGILDGAPVVYVDYSSRFGDLLSNVFTTGAAALGLLVVGVLVVAARVVTDSMNGF